jgi:hypothetical protein
LSSAWSTSCFRKRPTRRPDEVTDRLQKQIRARACVLHAPRKIL